MGDIDEPLDARTVSSRAQYGTVLRLAAPSFVEMMLSQMTSMVDMMMVGQLGPWALAAVGLSTQPKFLLMAAFIALNAGTTAMVARFRGAGERDMAVRVMRQALTLNLLMGIIISVAGYFASPWLIWIMGPETAQSHLGGTQYLQIQLIGFPVLALTATITAALRGAGNTRAAMIYNLVSNGVNIIGNYLLIGGNLGFPRLEVAGASIATVVGQCVAFIFAVVILARKRNFVFISRKMNWKPDFDIMRRLAKIGLPAMAEQLIIRAGLMAYSRVVTGLGDVAFATHMACMNIQAMSFVNGDAFGIAAASLMGQNLGRGQVELAGEYAKRARRLSMAVSAVLGVVMFFWGGNIVGLYNSDPEIVRNGALIMKIMAFIMPFQGAQVAGSGGLRGAGDTRSTSFIMFISVLLVRPISAVIFINGFHWGLMGAWYSMATDQLTRSALTTLRIKQGKWKTIRI